MKTNVSSLAESLDTFGGRIGFITFTALLGLYGVQLWFHATHASATYDEPVHILAGYRCWQCGDYGINPEHPPLLKLIATLPISWENLAGSGSPCGSTITPKSEGFYTGTGFLVKNGVDRILIQTRTAASLISLLLAVLVFLAAKEMFGRFEAFVALALFVFEPNLIAHGSLVTTDMAVTAGIFAAVFALYRYREKATLPRLLAGAHSRVGVGVKTFRYSRRANSLFAARCGYRPDTPASASGFTPGSPTRSQRRNI